MSVNANRTATRLRPDEIPKSDGPTPSREALNRFIARIAHEVIRGYCQALGDDSQPSWENAPAWQRDSLIAGIEFHRTHPNAQPRENHENWLAMKRAQGWRYGEHKETKAKTHPCLVPYDQLPQAQQAKDAIFNAVVKSLLASQRHRSL